MSNSWNTENLEWEATVKSHRRAGRQACGLGMAHGARQEALQGVRAAVCAKAGDGR